MTDFFGNCETCGVFALQIAECPPVGLIISLRYFISSLKVFSSLTKLALCRAPIRPFAACPAPPASCPPACECLPSSIQSTCRSCRRVAGGSWWKASSLKKWIEMHQQPDYINKPNKANFKSYRSPLCTSPPCSAVPSTWTLWWLTCMQSLPAVPSYASRPSKDHDHLLTEIRVKIKRLSGGWAISHDVLVKSVMGRN